MSEPQTPREVYRALQRRARDERRGAQELFEFYLNEPGRREANSRSVNEDVRLRRR